MKVFGNVDKEKDKHLNIYYSLEEKKAKRKDDIGREKGYLIIYIERETKGASLPISSAQSSRRRLRKR